jgi:dolichol-phosphate mannosyltransferase
MAGFARTAPGVEKGRMITPDLPAARMRTLAFRTGVGLCAGAILIVAFVQLVDMGAVYARLSNLNIGFALLCSVPFLGAYVVRALRWRLLLRPDEVSVPRAIAVYQVATFLNWLLPVRGGELAKSLLLRRSNGIPVSRSLATVTMDKAMDLVPAVALIAVLPFAGLQLSGSLWALLVSALAVVVLGSLVLVLAAWRRDLALSVLTRPVARVLPSAARQRVEPFIVQFVDTLRALVRQPRRLAVAAVYTAVAVALDALFCLLAFRAVGVSVSLPVVLYGYTFFNLAFILPTLPGQVGSNELIGLLIFAGLFGVDSAGVGAMFLFSHPWNAVLLTLSALVCLGVMGLSLRSTLSLAADSDEDWGTSHTDSATGRRPKTKEQHGGPDHWTGGGPMTRGDVHVPWVVLPTFNEAENLERIVAAIVAVLEHEAPTGFRVLVVDDDSPDGTGKIADRLAATNPAIEVLHRSEREGLGRAYVAGFRHALAGGAGYIMEMDADGSHDPRDLARLLRAVREGSADLALGSRYVDGGQIAAWSMARRATSRGGCWYARKVLGIDVRDLTGGFKCFAAEVLQGIDLANLRSSGYGFQVELTYRALCAGFRVQEVPISFHDREHGTSKMSWRIALEAALVVPQLRRDARSLERGRAVERRLTIQQS